MKEIKVGKPFEPSEVLEFKEEEGTELSISCGGGLGGQFWKEYTFDKVDLTNYIDTNFINLNTNLAEKEFINKQFIVKTRPVKIIAIKVQNQGNTYYGKLNEIKTYYYVVNNSLVVVRDDKVRNDNLDKLEEVNNANFIKF